MRLFPAASWQRDLSGEESNRGCSRKGHSNLCSDSQEFTSLMPLQPGKIASKLASPGEAVVCLSAVGMAERNELKVVG